MESYFPGDIKQRMKSHLKANITSVLSVKSSVERQWERRKRETEE